MTNPTVVKINQELNNLQEQLYKFKSTVDYLNGAEVHVKQAIQSVNRAEAHFTGKIEDLKKVYNSFTTLSNSISDVIIQIESVNFPDRLDKIEEKLTSTISLMGDIKNSTLDEIGKASETIIKADFEGKFNDLKKETEAIKNSNKELVKTVVDLKIEEKLAAFEKTLGKKFDFFEKKINENIDDAIGDLQDNTEKIANETKYSIMSLNLPVRMDKIDATIASINNGIQNIQGRLDLVERNFSDKISEMNNSHKKEIELLKESIISSNKKTTNLLFVIGGLIIILIFFSIK
jgi:hypothetical protein